MRLDLVLERVPDGIVVRGELHARWDGECSRCLARVAADLAVGVGELFEPHPLDGETYPLEGHEIDLEQLVRDALLLELPARAGVRRRRTAHPADRARGATSAPPTPTPPAPRPPIPRWAALSELDLSDSNRSNSMAVPKRKTPRATTRSAPRLEQAARPRPPARCARTAARRSSPTSCAATVAGTAAAR